METQEINIQQCIYPTETSRYWLAIIIVLPITLLFILVTVGIGLFIIPIIMVFSWIGLKIATATFIGSRARISSKNFPEIYQQIEEIRKSLNYNKKIDAYIYQNGDINAQFLKFFGTRMILLPHEIVVATANDDSKEQLTFFLASIIGHFKAKHMKLTWLNILVEGFEKIKILNIFLTPWERATHYSGDRIGLAVCSNLDAAMTALNKLILGNSLGTKMTLIGYLEQGEELRGSFFGWLSQSLSTHPHHTNRIIALLKWAKTYNSDMYYDYLNKQDNPDEIEEYLARFKV